MTLEAGAARVDMTPVQPVPLAGYPPIRIFEGGPQDHVGYTGRVGPSEGVHDRIYARALAISDNDNLAILTALDICVIPLAFTARIREEAAKRWNIDPDGIFLAASHSHSGPDYTGQWEDVDESVEQFIGEMTLSAIGQALSSVRPARIGWGEGDLSEPVVNRREPSRPIDPRVTVLRVDEIDGPTIAVAYCYACHPITIDSRNRLISGEYPGHASRVLETALGPGVVALFLNGAAGNINPRAWPYPQGRDISRLSKEFALAGKPVTFRSHREAQRLGTTLAGEALRVASLIETDGPGDVEVWRQEIQLRLKQSEDLEIFIEHDCLQDRYADLLRKSDAIPSEVIALRLGNTVLVGLPGEPFVEIGLDLQNRHDSAPDQIVRAVGYVNDYPGYVIRREDYAENRYETVATPLAPGAAETIIDAARALIAKAGGT